MQVVAEACKREGVRHAREDQGRCQKIEIYFFVHACIPRQDGPDEGGSLGGHVFSVVARDKIWYKNHMPIVVSLILC